jgi:hypothetical protein
MCNLICGLNYYVGEIYSGILQKNANNKCHLHATWIKMRFLGVVNRKNNKPRKRFVYGVLWVAEDEGLEPPSPKGGGFQDR